MTLTTFQKEIYDTFEWDPNEQGLNPKVEFNTRTFREVAKRFIEDAGYADKYLSHMSTPAGATLYQCLKKHVKGELFLAIMGKITVESLFEKYCENDTEAGFKPLHFDAGKEWMTQVRDAVLELNEAMGKNVEFTYKGDTLTLPSEEYLTGINALLSSAKVPDLNTLFTMIESEQAKTTPLKEQIKEQKSNIKDLKSTIEEQQKAVADLSLRAQAPVEVTVEKSDEVPEGKLVYKDITDIWPDAPFNFEIPTWEWDGVHPDVPEQDPNYVFRWELLKRVAYAVATNQRAYLQGHTGSGKTTLIEQFGAYTGWPTMRINFDSEITRMDLVGRDTLASDEEGNITSTFVDGMLPRMMSSPCLAVFDEIDFVRPDVAYVMQAALEGNGLRITEDGDRLVKPHPMFRMFGTGNTVGQGDEFGMYSGARPQSLAFLDRFTVWLKVGYLEPKHRKKLVQDSFPALKSEDVDTICQYVTEHLNAFESGEVVQTISPRGMLALAKAMTILGDAKEALEMTVLDKANHEDRATLVGLVDRVVK